MSPDFLDRLYSGLLVTAFELALIALICGVALAVIIFGLSRVAAGREQLKEWISAARVRVRRLAFMAAVALSVGAISYNGWLLAAGADPIRETEAFLSSVSRAIGVALALAVLKFALAATGLALAVRIFRHLLRSAEQAINRWDRIRSNNESLAALRVGLERVTIHVAWLLLAALASVWLGLPATVRDTLMLVVRIYLVLAVGVLIVRSTTFIVDTLDGWSERSARDHGWTHYYDHVRPLLPTFRACLEYALWILVGTLAVLQVNALGHLALWGPRLIQAIGIFFIGRVVIELGSLEIGNRMLPREGLESTERRRRETMLR